MRPSSGMAGHIPRWIWSNERDLVRRRLDEPHTAQNKIEAVQGKARQGLLLQLLTRGFCFNPFNLSICQSVRFFLSSLMAAI